MRGAIMAGVLAVMGVWGMLLFDARSTRAPRGGAATAADSLSGGEVEASPTAAEPPEAAAEPPGGRRAEVQARAPAPARPVEPAEPEGPEVPERTEVRMAAPPPRHDLKTEEGRAAAVSILNRTYRNEKREEEWASKEEESLGRFIEAFDLKEGMAEELRCATTVCRIAFEFGEDYEEDLATVQLRFGAAFGRRHVVESMGGGAKAQRFVVWTARPRHSIEQLEDALAR